jgi:hypothetical protein
MFTVELNADVDDEEELHLVIRNVGLVLGQAATPFDMLSEALQHLVDAQHLWSLVRLGEQEALVCSAMVSASTSMCAIDLSCAATLLTHVVDRLSILEGDQLAVPLEGGSNAVATATSVAECFFEKMRFESKFNLRAEILFKFVVKVGELFKDLPIAGDTCKAFQAMASGNARVRDRIAQLCLCLSPRVVQVVDMQAVDLLKDWETRKDESDLCIILDLVVAGKELNKDCQFSFDVQGAERATKVVLIDETKEGDDLTVDLEEIKGLTQLLLDLPLLGKAMAKVQETGSETLVVFSNACEFGGLRHVAPQCLDGDLGFVDIAMKLVNTAVMPQSIKNAALHFRSDEGSELMSTSSFNLVMEVFGLVPPEVLVPLCLATEPVTVSTSEALTMMTLHKHVHGVSSAVLYMGLELQGQKSSCLAEHVMRQDVLRAMDFMDEQLESACGLKTSHEREFNGMLAQDIAWLVPMQVIDSWLAAAVVASKLFKEQLFKFATMDVQSLANHLEQRIPKTDHICNDKIFVKTLVKKALLTNTALNKILSSETIKLFHALSQLGVLHKRFGLEDPSKHPVYCDIINHAQACFDNAKYTVSIIAAATVIIILKGPQQKAEASVLLEKKKDSLPKAIVVELSSIANA